MSDRYATLVRSGPGKALAKRLGLPRPAVLRRHEPGAPLLPGPVLVLGPGAGPSGEGAQPDADADAVARTLLDWDLDVRRHAAQGDRLGAVVLVLTGLQELTDLTGPAFELSGVLRDLAPGGRVVTISRPATSTDAPALAAARQGVDGFLRSLAKELRAGATGNGLLLEEGIGLDAVSVQGALRFLLSGRSAFVDGQLLRVGSDAGALPADWERSLAGRVAVVTGGARGIGAAIARTLARDGARVVVVDVPAAGEALTRVANEVQGTALQLDITAADAGPRILEHAQARHGRLDIVVHNAGILRDKLLANMTRDRWDPVLDVNLAAQLRINEHLLAAEVFRDAPRIVTLSSTSGIAGNRGQTNYATTKAGVIGMVRATAPLLADVGGTVNAVAPGIIETEMVAKMPTATREVARRLNSLQQGGQPIDVAETVAFLSSPQAGGITGQVLRVCGQNMVGA